MAPVRRSEGRDVTRSGRRQIGCGDCGDDEEASVKALLAVALGAVVLGTAACGGDDGGEAQAMTAEVTSTGDGRFELTAPESLEAGLVRLEFTNSTEDQADAQLVRVDGDHSLDEVLAVFESETTPDWINATGGAGQIAPGATGVAELVLEEGTYYLADLGSPPGDNPPSHAENGATAMFTVSGDDGGELSEVDASIEMADYNFVPEGLKAGKNTLLLTNTGKEIHHTLAVPINEGATMADVREFVTSDGPPSGPPPLDFEKLTGTSALDAGREQIAELELEAGRYAFLCFISDRAGGPPHVAKGMVREVTIEE
jgi:hypothetical protein